MKRDGRKLAHNTLEELRVLAVTRMSEGEHPAAVAASLGLNRSWAYKCRALAKGSEHGLKALRSTKGAFWFAVYQGALTGEVFVQLLEKMMYRRKKPVRLVLDSMPAHKHAVVKDFVASLEGKLTLHFLPGYAPDLNPDELVWSHAKRTEVARAPLKAGEKLQCRVHSQLQNIANNRALVKSFFRYPSVSYISDS